MQVGTLTLPGLRGAKIGYKGAKAAQKFVQSKKVETLFEDKTLRIANLMAAGADILSDVRKLSDVMKKLGVKQ